MLNAAVFRRYGSSRSSMWWTPISSVARIFCRSLAGNAFQTPCLVLLLLYFVFGFQQYYVGAEGWRFSVRMCTPGATVLLFDVEQLTLPHT